jgi:DNA-binding NarL/FixJ family response regulator
MKTVVIIDDHEMMRAGLVARLRERWRILGEAASLEQAKALLSGLKKAPDLVLLDLELGEEWGIDIIKSISTPVLVYSVYDDYAHIKAVMRSGAAGFVCKSQGAEELLEAMEDAAAGKTVFTSSLLQRMAAGSDLMLGLTKREREIFTMVQRGFSNRDIAATWGVSVRTIENNLSIIYDKTGVNNRRELEKL